MAALLFILNLDWWFRNRCLLKIFLIWSYGGPFVQRSRNICAILIEGIMRNNYVNLFRIWTSGSGDVIIWSSGGPPVQWSGNIYKILKEGIMGNIHMKLF